MIPEVTEQQIHLMKTVCFDPTMSVFSQHAPLPTDSLPNQIEWARANADADYLVTLGFLKNITANHMEQITKTNADTGRVWQVYEVTAMGRAMFQALTSAAVN